MNRMPADEQALAEEEEDFGGVGPQRAAVSSDAKAEGDPAPAAMVDLHNAGECRPCLYYNSKRGCINGDTCRFCHLAHGKKTRPCKSKRTECKQIADMLHTVFGEESVEFRQAATRLSAESTYMRTILGKTRPGAAAIAAGAASSTTTHSANRTATEGGGYRRSPEEAAAIRASFAEGALTI